MLPDHVHHHDPLGGGVIHIHIINAHTGPPGAGLGALSITSGVILVADRTTMAALEEFIGKSTVHHDDLEFEAGFQRAHALGETLSQTSTCIGGRSLGTGRGSVKPRA